MSFLPEECISDLCDKKIVVSEKGKKFQLNNRKLYKAKIVNIDDCVIKNRECKSCDYGIILDECLEGYLIELKGSDLKRACKQILDTVKYIKNAGYYEFEELKLFAAIVTSKNKVPRLKQSPEYIKLSRFVAGILIKNSHIQINK